jgi:hypothetical protein
MLRVKEMELERSKHREAINNHSSNNHNNNNNSNSKIHQK